MITLVAKYQAKPGKGDQVEAALKRLVPLVTAQEPGCKLFQANRSAEHPDQFLLYELYMDQAALDAHRATSHFKQIVEQTIVPMLDKRERELYEFIA